MDVCCLFEPPPNIAGSISLSPFPFLFPLSILSLPISGFVVAEQVLIEKLSAEECDEFFKEITTQNDLRIVTLLSELTPVHERDSLAEALVEVFSRVPLPSGSRKSKVSALVNRFDTSVDREDNLAQVARLLSHVIKLDVSTTVDETTLLRSNSLASKVLVRCGKRYGDGMLSTAVKPSISYSVDNSPAVEVNQSKLEPDEVLEDNQKRLRELGAMFVDNIIKGSNSEESKKFAVVCHIAAEAARDKFPESQMRVLSGFVFLRIICPSIVTPHTYGLVSEPVTRDVRRALTLVCKLLQNAANGVEFGTKEEYMKPMNDWVLSNADSVYKYLLNLASTGKSQYERLLSDSDTKNADSISNLDEVSCATDEQLRSKVQIIHKLVKVHESEFQRVLKEVSARGIHVDESDSGSDSDTPYVQRRLDNEQKDLPDVEEETKVSVSPQHSPSASRSPSHDESGERAAERVALKEQEAQARKEEQQKAKKGKEEKEARERDEKQLKAKEESARKEKERKERERKEKDEKAKAEGSKSNATAAAVVATASVATVSGSENLRQRNVPAGSPEDNASPSKRRSSSMALVEDPSVAARYHEEQKQKNVKKFALAVLIMVVVLILLFGDSNSSAERSEKDKRSITE